MTDGNGRVVEAISLAESLVLLWIETPKIPRPAHPGQFLMMQCGEGDDPYLPRPFSYCGARTGKDGSPQYALLVQPLGHGSGWLLRRRPGDQISLFGPLGQVLTLRADTRNLLLIADGVRVAPLLWLADLAIARGINVTLILGYAHEQPVFPAARLAPQIELVLTEAGSDAVSAHAMLSEHLRWSDQVVVAGEEPILRRIAAELQRLVSRRSVQAIVWQPFACGTGACAGCPIETRRHGSRLVCRDGPRFELNELY